MPAYAYLQNINRERTEVCLGSQSLDLDGLSLQEALVELNRVSLELPAEVTKTRIDVEGYDGYGTINLVTYGLETEEQRDARVERQEAYNRTVEQRRRAEYEQTKREFEAE